MNLPRAIENRELYLKNSRIPKSTEDYNATLLSIEALKRLAFNRLNTIATSDELLPGETED